MTIFNTLPDLRSGAFTKSLQDEIIEKIKSNSDPINVIISDIIRLKQYRDEILLGLYKRFNLEPASTAEWVDPRKADGVPILARQKISETSVNHRINHAFDNIIASNKASYVASGIKTVIQDLPDNQKDVLNEEYKEFFTNNNMKTNFVNMMEPP